MVRSRKVGWIVSLEGHLVVSQLVVDGAELVKGLRVVVLQLGRGLEVADGFAQLASPDQTLGPHLSRLHVPDAGLTPAHRQQPVLEAGQQSRVQPRAKL